MIGSGQKFTRGKLVEAMESAATVDLRADQVLPYLLRVLKSAPITDPAVADAVDEAAGLAGGRQPSEDRRARRSKTYDHAEAIRILDAWWPLLVPAQFQGLGPELYNSLVRPRRSTSGRARRVPRSRAGGGDSSSATCARCSAIR